MNCEEETVFVGAMSLGSFSSRPVLHTRTIRNTSLVSLEIYQSPRDFWIKMSSAVIMQILHRGVLILRTASQDAVQSRPFFIMQLLFFFLKSRKRNFIVNPF